MTCPTCGASGDDPCTTFGWVRYGVPTERYPCEPHALRAVASSYWRVVGIRLALLDTDTRPDTDEK
jgi:hypothetical protein